MESALDKLASKPVGRSLLKEIMANTNNDHKVSIVLHEGPSMATPMVSRSQLLKVPGLSDKDIKGLNYMGVKFSSPLSLGGFGQGSDALIYWNKANAIHVDDQGVSHSVKNPETSFVTLGHELIHSLHIIKGQYLTLPQDSRGTFIEEEYKTVGLGIHQNQNFTENKIREEVGLNKRQSYYFGAN